MTERRRFVMVMANPIITVIVGCADCDCRAASPFMVANLLGGGGRPSRRLSELFLQSVRKKTTITIPTVSKSLLSSTIKSQNGP